MDGKPWRKTQGYRQEMKGSNPLHLPTMYARDKKLMRSYRKQSKQAQALVKKPRKVFWGGYSGYFKDLDGHLWEVVHHPLFRVGPADENA